MTNTDQQEQLYRWVKASERLPENNNGSALFFIKYEFFHLDNYVESSGTARRLAGKWISPAFDDLSKVKNIRWLEPYTPLEDAGQRGEAYLCPKCHGQGITGKPPYVPGDVDHWVSTSLSHQCDICNGAKVLFKAQSSTPVQEECYTRQDVINAWNSAYGGDSFLSGEDYEASLIK